MTNMLPRDRAELIIAEQVPVASFAQAPTQELIGRLRDATGSYVRGCLILIGLAIVGAVAALFLPADRRTA